MKKTLFLLFILCGSILAFSQEELMVENNGNGLYVSHSVLPKENFYSVGRLYNISPKEIASFNQLDMGKGLIIGQVIKIPLVANNFSQTASSGRALYYTVGENEGLYRVSTKNNKVLMANLRKWNRLTNDKLTPGEKLIVGFLVSPEANKIVAVNTKNISPAKEIIEPPIKANKDFNEKQETIRPKSDEVNNTAPAEERKQPVIAPKPSPNLNHNDGGSGYFKLQYEQQIKAQPTKTDITASAGIFKTTSGWQDAKYYALIDNVEPGTIMLTFDVDEMKTFDCYYYGFILMCQCKISLPVARN